MEFYLKSWEGITKSYQNFSQNNSAEFEMKNSLKFDDDKEKVGSNDSGADSLPIHCLVQTCSSLKDLKSSNCHYCNDKNISVESWWECECKKNEMSGCIVIPENVLMDDLVRTALVKLGYPASVSSFAIGSILIRNWKPLPLEMICPDMKKTVGDILGEISAVISLKIQIFRPKITMTQKMKDDLLLFLIKTNQNFLRDTRCPFDLSVLAKFCDQSANMKMHLLQEPSEDLQKRFDTWLEELKETEKATGGRKNQFSANFFFSNNNKNLKSSSSGEKGIPSPGVVESKTQETDGKQMKMPCEKENLNFAKEPLFNLTERQKHFSTPKTRVRTSFDPEFELPKLQKWYLKNPHPSRQQIYEYVAELNSLDSRKGRKQLDVNNVVYWFKNARAAQKRTECRKFSNVSATETNRCNVLKIPLGKNCGITSDDQRSISDDDGSVSSESADDCRQENGRCLQVLGKWNSNGQGEAVLEMQIPSRKSELSQPVLVSKKDKINEEENSKNAHEESNDSAKQDSFSGKKYFHSGASEKSLCQKENQMEEKKNEVKIQMSENKQNQYDEANKKNEISSSKSSIRTTFPSCKENGEIIGNDFLPPCKSGYSGPPNSVLNSSFMCMSQYMSSKPSSLPLSSEERRKRNRTFIDPVTEVPRLEQWFRLSTHPSHSLIARYTEELNNMPYRRKFPKLEAKNVQFWFKNRRAKNKRVVGSLKVQKPSNRDDPRLSLTEPPEKSGGIPPPPDPFSGIPATPTGTRFTKRVGITSTCPNRRRINLWSWRSKGSTWSSSRMAVLRRPVHPRNTNRTQRYLISAACFRDLILSVIIV